MDLGLIKQRSLRFLEGLHDGRLGISDAYELLRELEPVLQYFLIRHVREASTRNPVAGEKLVELVGTYSDLSVKVPKEDEILQEWFDDSHGMREFSSPEKFEEFVDLILDKLEG